MNLNDIFNQMGGGQQQPASLQDISSQPSGNPFQGGAWDKLGQAAQTPNDMLTTDPSTGRNMYTGQAANSSYLNSLRQTFKIPANVSDQQVLQWSQKQLPGLIEEQMRQRGNGSFMDQLKEFATVPAQFAGMAFGGPVGGTIAGMNASGASTDMGIPEWAQMAGQIGGTLYSGVNPFGGSEGSPQMSGTEGQETLTGGAGADALEPPPQQPMGGSDMNNPMNPANDPLAGVDLDAAGLGQSVLPPNVGGGLGPAAGAGAAGPLTAESAMGAGAGASAAAGGGGLLDWLGTQISGAKDGLTGGSMTGGGMLAGAGANFLINQYMRNQAQKQAQQTQQAGNPLNDPQRQTYQQQSANLVNNPQDYFKNNPFATALTNQYRNNVIPSQVAKSGNPSQVIDNAGSAFATALGGNYNQLLNTLQGYGGFNQGNSGVGPSVNLQSQGNMFGAESFRGAGNVISDAVSNIFGDPTKPNQGGAATAFGTTKLGA